MPPRIVFPYGIRFRPAGEVVLIRGLDVIIRLDDASDVPRLDRALFTVFAQSLPLPVNVHLMLARFSINDLKRLRQMTEPLRRLSDGVTVVINNWQPPKPPNVRLPILNWGIELTTSRYLTVLEVSDLLGAGAYARLLGRLYDGDQAIVAAPLAMQSVDWWGDSFVPNAARGQYPDVARGSGSAMVFMLDRSLVKLNDLVFTASETGAEIAEFVNRMRTRYGKSSSWLETVIGVRQIPN